VWEWSGSALDEGEDAAAWFSAYLGRPCCLMRHVGSPGSAPGGGSSTNAAVPANAIRLSDPEFAPGAEVGFADGFPLLFATEVRVFHIMMVMKSKASTRAAADCSWCVLWRHTQPVLVLQAITLGHGLAACSSKPNTSCLDAPVGCCRSRWQTSIASWQSPSP
jgi:hypothetical protein